MRIVIELEPEYIERELDVDIKTLSRYILMDALAEFQSNRGPTAEEYVNRRYPNEMVYSGKRREEKIKQVDRRKRIAEILRCGNIKVEW